MKIQKDEQDIEKLRREAEEEGAKLVVIPILPIISWVLLIPVITLIGSGRNILALAYLSLSVLAMVKSKMR